MPVFAMAEAHLLLFVTSAISRDKTHALGHKKELGHPAGMCVALELEVLGQPPFVQAFRPRGSRGSVSNTKVMRTSAVRQR